MDRILSNSDFITGIDKVIEGFGATPSSLPLTPDQANDILDYTVYNTKMTELAAAVPSGGGSGGGMFLIPATVANDFTITLTKTWKEVWDAVEDGLMPWVRVPLIEGVEYITAPVIDVSTDTLANWYVGVIVYTNEQITTYLMTTDSENGYPSVNPLSP